jgi:hypothetical protein
VTRPSDPPSGDRPFARAASGTADEGETDAGEPRTGSLKLGGGRGDGDSATGQHRAAAARAGGRGDSEPPSGQHRSGAVSIGAGRTGSGRGGGSWPRLVRRVVAGWFALLEQPWPWVAATLLLGAWSLLPPGLLFAPRVAAGSIAARDFVAPADLELLDAAATAEKRRRAREEVLPVYDYDPGVRADLEGDLGRLFAAGRRALAVPESAEGSGGEAPAGPPAGEELAALLAEASGLRVPASQAAVLAADGFSSDLEDRVRGAAGQALSRQVVAAKARLLDNPLRGITLRNLATGGESPDYDPYDRLGYPDEVSEFIGSQVRAWPGLSARERREVVDLLVANLAPNLHLNRTESERRREEAEAAVEPLFTRVRKGQVIVRKGDEVTAAEAEAIARFTGRSPLHERVLPVLGTLALLALGMVLLRLTMRGERVADHSPVRAFNEALLLLVMSLVGARFVFTVARALAAAFETSPLSSVESYVYAVPFAALAILASLLLGRQAATVLSVVLALLVSRLAPGAPVAVVVYSLAGSLAAIFGLEHYQFKQRLVLARIGLLVGGVNVGAVLMLVALAGGADRGPAVIAFDVLCAFAGGLLASAVAAFMVPILEAMCSITTDIKLVELANTNLPLLRRLAFEAPGSFQHSLMVANLAKVGSEAVGADATLAYTAGLYHDVGKVYRPEYFVENQRPGHNPHDKLQPSMSALILVSHVKEGVEVAREHHLPQVVLDAIEQHHGTRLIKFFYNRAIEQTDPDTGVVGEDKYRYPGPKPKSKVMGVLMLADAVEAASRTLIDPTPAKVRGLIRTLVEDCLSDRQLDHTDLTLADLRAVAEAFQHVLTNIFHRRVDYPGFDFNAPPRRERRSAEAVRAS